MTPTEEVAAARDELLDKLAQLADEVSAEETALADKSFESIQPLLAGWGRIPNETLTQIGEMCDNLDRLSSVESMPGAQAKLAAAPAKQVSASLDNLITRIREKKAESA
jgi:hypothetical protein